MASRDESLPKCLEAYLELYDFVGEKSAEALIFKCKQRGCAKEILAQQKTALFKLFYLCLA